MLENSCFKLFSITYVVSIVTWLLKLSGKERIIITQTVSSKNSNSVVCALFGQKSLFCDKLSMLDIAEKHENRVHSLSIDSLFSVFNITKFGII